ncbi:MAG: IS630 family transposase, partial [Wolbachia pipientis]
SIYDTIGLLEDVLCNFIVNISSTTIKRVCNVSYLFGQ